MKIQHLLTSFLVCLSFLVMSTIVFAGENLYLKAKNQYDKGLWLVASQSLYAYYYYEGAKKGGLFKNQLWEAYKFAHAQAAGKKKKVMTRGFGLTGGKPVLPSKPPK